MNVDFFAGMHMPKTTYMFSSPGQFKKAIPQDLWASVDLIVSSFKLRDWLTLPIESRRKFLQDA